MTFLFVFYSMAFSISLVLMAYNFSKNRVEQGATFFILMLLFFIGLNFQLSLNNGAFRLGVPG